jgi:GST-like protein
VSGAVYTIADIAIYTWYGAMMSSAYNAQEFLSVHEYTNVKRWMDLLEARPGVQRGRIVNRVFGNPQLAERHSAGDIDAVLSANP